ncbi:COP9 signalosome catalytic subunit rri1 [Ascosphaera aggregata]|nr:COP9 signalosome catalytic subunit rri1 [Ascosphaera aggregata]
MSSLPDSTISMYDPARDSLYSYPPPSLKQLLAAKPWRKELNYFKTVRISPIALSKMTIHARSGGSTEVMGLMTGYVLPHEIIVTDAFPLPVEGTETRVNAQEDAYTYMVSYLELSRSAGRLENAVGWYHSHPGYGCWLSGIDVETQILQQTANDPFCAVVIDPEKTASSGKVEIGAFRTYPKPSSSTDAGGNTTTGNEQQERENPAENDGKDGDGGGGDNSNSNSNSKKKKEEVDRAASIPLSKLKDFGVHANKYYPLTVTHYKSSLDSYILSQLHNRYWAGTLSAAPSDANRSYATKQLQDFTAKIGDFVEKHVLLEEAKLDGLVVVPPLSNRMANGDDELNRIVKEGRRIGMEERAVVTGEEMKERIFSSE